LSAYFTREDEKEMFEKMMDNVERNIDGRGLIFSQRHRIRWWAAKGLRFWIKQNAPERIEFT
jgi:hypothetical protein